MNIFEQVKANEALLIEIRRHLHRHPELSGREDQTVAYVCAKLDEFGVRYTNVPRGGILAEIGDESRGRTVLLRADMDALPMQENPDNLKGPKVVVSENDGACHACGHDGHTAMLLVAAKLLKQMEGDLPGRVVLCFERGEETGAWVRYLFRHIQRTNMKIDAVYGTHLLSTYETGQLSMEPGGVMAGAVGFDIDIVGRGGHGSRPDLSISPIDCFNAFYNSLNALRMKYISPFESLIFSMGKVQAGAQGNIIPDRLSFSGTARFFNGEMGRIFRDEFLHLLQTTCEAYRCTYEINRLSNPGTAVTNNAELSAFAKAAVAKHLGDGVVGRVDPWMASESFSLYLRLWPGVFAFLGMKNPDKGVGAEHHNERFDVDEDVLPIGAAAAVAYAVEYLQQNPDTPSFTPYPGTPVELLEETGFGEFED